MPSSPDTSDSLTSSLITRSDANAILAQRYPTDKELARFPLGARLQSIPAVDPRYGSQPDSTPGHIERVLDGVNILLSHHPEAIVAQWADDKPFEDTISFESAFKHIFRGDPASKTGQYCRFPRDTVFDPFFRLLALYHDIGKSVITERHPTVGWHLVKDVYHQQVLEQLYPFILGRDYENWQRELTAASGNIDEIDQSDDERRLLKIFNSVVRYHDYFGILSTGEGSLPIMVDLVDLRGVDPKDAQELFSILMLFNLADVYGSVPQLLPQKVNTFCTDWEMSCNSIASEQVHGDRELFFADLLKHSQTAEATIERIWRLMFEGAPEQWQRKIHPDVVEEVFKDVTLSRMYPFIKNFALFCKLDYCLAFKIMLMQESVKRDMNLSIPIKMMITILAELEKRYGDLCQRRDGTWRRLGFEMAGLTRRPATHKDAQERRTSRI